MRSSSPPQSSQSSLSMLSAAPSKIRANAVLPTPLAPKRTTLYGLPGSVFSPVESVEMTESEEDQLTRLSSDSPVELLQDLEREMQAGTRARSPSGSRWLPGSQMLQRWSSVCRRRLWRRTEDSMVVVVVDWLRLKTVFAVVLNSFIRIKKTNFFSSFQMMTLNIWKVEKRGCDLQYKKKIHLDWWKRLIQIFKLSYD